MSNIVWMRRALRPEAIAKLETGATVKTHADWADLPGAGAVVIGGEKVDADFMDKAGDSLLAITRPGIGVDTIDIAEATRRGILVINTPDAPTESTAEHTVALLMSIAKRVVAGDMQLRGTHSINRAQDLLGTELLNRTLGVLGYGRIGRRVAEICALGLRMQVLVYDPFIDPAMPAIENISLTNSLDAVLDAADFLTIHTPLTAETRHLIGEAQFARMKPGAYIINASRGPVIDEPALIKALQNGHLAGAALDVFDPEPPQPDNPLLHMTNVVLTPHIASYTDAGTFAMTDGVAEQILQVFRGERPPHIVNPEAWPGRVKPA